MASGTLLTEQDMKAFLDEYGGLIRDQCISLVGDTEAARELEARVIRSIREKYEYRPVPEHCETMLIAQCCILSSWMEAGTEGVNAGAAPDSAGQPGAPESREAPGPQASQAPEAPEEELPESIRGIQVTAVYDPEKTALWLPGSVKADRIKTRTEPEDEEEVSTERSVPHSMFNTFLVLVLLGSVGFFMWNTGIIRWLNRWLEGLFVYG